MNLSHFPKQFPVTRFFIIAFTISWTGAFIIVAPRLFAGQPIPKLDGLLMFPLMLIGPSAAGIILTAVEGGKPGLRDLKLRMGQWKLPLKWVLMALLIPPCLILIVLSILSSCVSPSFTPNFFIVGILFGIPAGFLEEIGWMGYAFPKLSLKFGARRAGLILGILWGIWHLPVIDFLGAASPHRAFLPLFFLAFIAILTAMRLLMAFVYSKTNSILIVQFMHIISTGSLVVFGPFAVSPGQEALWYGLYAAFLWVTVLIFVRRFGVQVSE